MRRVDINTSSHGVRKFRVLDQTPVFTATKAIPEGVVVIKVWHRRRRLFLAEVIVTTDSTKTYVGDGNTVRSAVVAGFKRMKEWNLQRIVLPAKFRVLLTESQAFDEDNADLE